MAQSMAYFRIKRRRLGEAYARFLAERLEPGGLVIIVECRPSWPITRIGPRHVFQVGGSGGLGPEEYLHGGPRVARWFAEHGLKRALGCAGAGRREPRGGMGFRGGAARGRRAIRGRTGTSGPEHILRRS